MKGRVPPPLTPAQAMYVEAFEHYLRARTDFDQERAQLAMEHHLRGLYRENGCTPPSRQHRAARARRARGNSGIEKLLRTVLVPL